MIRKELTTFIIAYNLIRSLMWQAALDKGIAPYRISFKGTIATIIQWLSLLTAINTNKEKRQFIDALRQVIANDVIPG